MSGTCQVCRKRVATINDLIMTHVADITKKPPVVCMGRNLPSVEEKERRREHGEDPTNCAYPYTEHDESRDGTCRRCDAELGGD